MIVELSPKKIISGAFTCWNQETPDTDLVVDLKKLSFKENSIDELYSFHVLDHLFLYEIVPALENWRRCLKPGRKLFVIVDDYEYLARAFVGGDITVDELNQNFAHPTNLTRDNLIKYFTDAGFTEDKTHIWYGDILNPKGELILPKKHFELIFDANK